MGKESQTPKPEVHDDLELIDDRALDSAEGDRFGHADIADELTRTALSVRTPANIALYGAWGAGKTGLANLVREKVKALGRKDVRFARFDAFKYAELPLRRHVISQIAEQLGISDSRYSQDLYRTTQDTEFTMPGTKFLRLLLWFLLVLGVVLAAAVAAVAIVAWIAKGSFGTNFAKFIASGLPLAFAPAALIAGFVALTGKTLTFQRTSGAPSSDEEFEKLFRDIINECGAKRIVIFVDELDRCSAEEVVETLDTVRTFLDVPGCVFIVAADQQVVEQALRRKARQTTPVDVSNPYYSAGSAYLDKVFHYQIALPPLTPRRLSRFALELVKTKSGLWNDIDKDAVVSVLVPTHVRSPRRVKVLLNNFVLAYRLMSRRMDSGLLEGDAKDRGAELAKLVCLRTEFPLFAADLPMDARLPQFVLALYADQASERPAGVTDEAWERAGQYARGQLPVETNLASSRAPTAVVVRPPTTEASTEEETLEDESIETSSGETEISDNLSHAQLQQLIAYLSRTQHVTGPRRDLVYLESFGAAFGLEPGLAEQLEDLAVDGRIDEVIRVFGALDNEGEKAALRLLASRIREAPPGIEGQNAVSTLLRVLSSRSGENIASIADELAEAIASPAADYQLRPEELSGAFTLGLTTRRPAGQTLVANVLGREEVLEDSNLGILVLANADRCPKSSVPRMGEAVASLIFDVESRDRIAETLGHLNPGSGSAVLLAAITPLANLCNAAKAAAEGTEERAALDDAAETMEAILDAVLTQKDRGMPEAAVQLALAADYQAFRNAVENRLGEVGQVRSQDCALAILSGCLPRAVSSWPEWLGCLSETTLSTAEHATQLEKLSLKLWDQALETGEKAPKPEDLKKALSSLARFLKGNSAVSREVLAKKVIDAIGTAPADETAVAQQNQRLASAQQFCTTGILDLSTIAEPALATLSSFARSGLPIQAADSAFVKHLQTWAPSLIKPASLDSRRDFDSAITSSPWLPAPILLTLRLLTMQSILREDKTATSPFSADEIAEAASTHGVAFGEGLGIWIRSFAANVDEAWKVAGQYSRGTIPENVADALREFSGRLTPSERLVFAALPIQEDATDCPTETFLEALHFSECDQGGAVDLLVARYSQTRNSAERRKVMRCWATLKPVKDEHRRTLIEKIFIPLVLQNNECYELAIEYLAVTLPPPYGTKKRIGQAFLEQASVPERLRQKAADKLKAAGLAKGRGWLGRKTEPLDE